MEQIQFRAMGCEIFVAVDVTSRHAQARLVQVPGMFKRWEQCLSRFRPDSELSKLNSRSGRVVQVSETLWDVVEFAQRAAQLSQGLVQPLLLDALEAAGYDRSFEQVKAGRSLASNNRKSNDFRLLEAGIERDAAAHTITLPYGARLDLGGIAKGWAAEQAANSLGLSGPTCVDVGGDMAISAPRVNGKPWLIGIENPFAEDDQDDSMPLLKIERGAVATSGRDYRHWLQHGRKQHHIIDPRTGEPASTDVLTATVVAPTALQAEVAAKVAFILGSDAGLKWIEARRALAALLILENGRVIESERLQDFCW